MNTTSYHVYPNGINFIIIIINNHIYFHYNFTGFVVEDEELEPSSNVQDMSATSAETIMLVFFETISIHFLTVKKHFLPLGKALNVKCRSLGKYQLLIPLAKALVMAGHVKIEVEDGSEVNYREVSRKQVKKCADRELLLSKNTQSESESPDLDDSISVLSQLHA